MPESLDARARSVFDQVIDRTGAERGLHLERACAGAPELRMRVEQLLAAADRDDGFLGDPTLNLAPPALPLTVGEQPGARIGPYTLLELIGEGGFGSVFLAEQSVPIRRRVALKIIKAGMDTRQVIARFEAERQALALMDHPNIARVLDAGATDAGRPYFVMELVRGERITRFCDEQRLGVTQRLKLFQEICAAVQHAHQKGVVHRDLKPSNILVTAGNGAPHVKVIDFGIAKATSENSRETTVTRTHQFLGTPEYMSPEQVAGAAANIDTRSDIYSLGVVLYELLTGATPFRSRFPGSSELDGFRRIICEQEPQRPSLRVGTLGSPRRRKPSVGSSGALAVSSSFDANAGVSVARPAPGDAAEVAMRRGTDPVRLASTLRRDIDWIVLKCLEKDASRRYQTVNGLDDDIDCYLDDRPVQATPPSRGYQLRKFVRRNRGTVVAGVAIGAALLIGIIGATLGMMWALRERDRAAEEQVVAQREAKQARAVNEFMREVLTSVEPSNRGADVRLRDVLAAASVSAAKRFADHPLQEAQVRELLGDVYANLGLWKDAPTEFLRGAELCRQFAGEADPRTFRVECRLIGTYLNLNQTGSAEELLASILPRMRAVLSADDPAMLDVRLHEANTLIQRGKREEASAILIELRAHPSLADDDRMQIRILNSLFRAKIARPGAIDHADRLAQAELCKERVQRSMRFFGPHSPVTAMARVHLATLLSTLGDFAASADLCQAVIADSAERLGSCHDALAQAMTERAFALGRLGEAREPAQLYLSAIDCRRVSYPAGSIPVLVNLCDALPYLDRAGFAAEGEAVAREAIEALQAFGGGHGDMGFLAEVYRAGFTSMSGHLDEATSMFHAVMMDSSAELPQRAQAVWSLAFGKHLVRCGAFEQAEREFACAALLRGGVCTGTLPNLPDDIVLAYVQLYRAWDRHKDAREYEQLRESCFGIASQ